MQTQYQKGGYIQPLWYKAIALLRVYFDLGDGERCIQQNIEIDTKSEDELIQLTKKEFLDKEYQFLRNASIKVHIRINIRHIIANICTSVRNMGVRI